MQVTTLETNGLGDRSYLITSGRTAVVVDPQRDIDRITALLDDGVDLALVCETHVHNDYVTGGLALARTTGAQYLLNADDDVSFDRRGVTVGEVIEVGDLTIRVVHSPGHTLTDLSYVVQEGEETAVFTGGSMLYDTVGRTDLLGPDLADQLSRSQYRSVRGLARDLPPTAEVFPTHGFGSFCASAGGGSRTQGTIADERQGNLACTTEDEEEFVTALVEGFRALPPYYVHMGLLNRAGPLSPDLTTPAPADPAELAARIARGEWVVDVRPRADFAAAHLAGIDVRRDDEWDEGHVEGAVHITMERLAAQADDLPDGDEVWVHCASGFRASIAASLLARAGKHVTWIDDGWDDAADAGVPVAG